KMRALTLLYEQQKRASFSLRNPNHNHSPKPEDLRFKAQLLDSCKKGDDFHRQDGKDSNFVEEDTKENNVAEADRIFGVNSVPVKPSAVIRKLSMGNGARNVTEADKIESLDASVSR
ncbi:PREDICTED: kinesin-like protein KIN-8A, partial [Camelina sativa]